MKHQRSFLFFVVFFFSKFLMASGPLTGMRAGQYVKGADQVWLNPQSTIPSFILFNEAEQPAFDSPDLWLRLNFGMQPGFSLQRVGTESDGIGYVHYRYRQKFNGLLLDGTMWLVHVKNGRVVSMNGLLFDKMKDAGVPVISKESARQRAIDRIPAGVYKWQIPAEEEWLKRMKNDPGATYFPEGELLYAFDSRNPGNIRYRLSYRFDIYADSPLERKYVSVDAATGEIIDVQDRIHEINTNATAVTGYAGTQTIVTDSVNATTYRLREAGRGAGLGMETYNMLQGTTYGNAVDFTDSDNYWNNVNAARDQYATDAHFATEKTYDYYYTRYGRNSVDDAGMKLLSYVHYSSGYVNAFWDGSRMTYGDGNGTYTPLTSLDIGGHEITHGVTEFTANLIYSYESGALNESFSDCFGTAVEWYADPAHADWLIGEDIGAPFRSHSNPNAYGDPDTYQGLNWYSGSGDNGGVHTNSGVQNYWFYLLSVGGSGTNDIGNTFNVTGLGIDKAAAIAYRSLSVYLTSTSQYEDARLFSIQAAIDLYGNCSPEMFATIDAWYAVGVGGPGNLPTTLQQQGPTTFCDGQSVQLAATAPFGATYTWYRNGALISGAGAAYYAATTSGNYYVVTNSCGTVYTSNTIAVSVITLSPTITPSGTVSSCNNVTMTAGNTAGYNVQWKKDGIPISGATAPTYTASVSGDYSFALNATVTPPQTFSNAAVVSIPDNACTPPAISTIAVSGLPASIHTTGITISVNVTHTYDGDLHLMLEAPNGDILGLSRETGGSGNNFVNTQFSDAAVDPLTAGTPPFTGIFRPWPTTFASCIATNKTSFASIGNGSINPNGNWKFHVYDRYGVDVGTIDSWSITFPAITQPAPDCGPVNSPATSISIGTQASITLNVAASTECRLSPKNSFGGTPRSFGTSVTLGDKGYFGFGDNTYKNDWWEYDPLTDSWMQMNDCPAGLLGAASFSLGNKAYVIGGYSGAASNAVYAWDPLTNTWQLKNPFPGGARAFASAATSGGKGYLIGGNDGTGTFNDIWEYDPGADQWALKGNVPGPVNTGRTKMASFSIGPRIYFGLGQTCGIPCVPAYSNEWFEYDPQSNSITAKGNYPGNGRESSVGFALDDKGYIAFGKNGTAGLSDYWEYEPVQDSWTLKGSYGNGLYGASSAVIKNAAYLFCGNVNGSPVHDVLQFKVISKVCTNAPASVTLHSTTGNTYQWNTGATTQNILGATTGEYSVLVTNSGCSAAAYKNLEVYPFPNAAITASGPLSFCAGRTVNLTASPATAYMWSNGANTGSITVGNSGFYTVTVTGAGGCTSVSAPATVIAYPGPPVTVTGDGPLSFCQGGSVSLNSYSYQSIPYAPIGGSGNVVTLTDDQLSGALPIGFSFTFFNNTYSNFYISSNGFITFGATTSGCCTGQQLPNTLSPNNLIAFAWNDLYPPAGGSIEYFTTGSSPDRRLVVKFNNIQHYPTGNAVNAQVVLFETTNLIEIHTTSMPSNNTAHTMGLENSNGTQAIIYPGRNGVSWSASNEGVRFTSQPVTYQWSGGETTANVLVTNTGAYSVLVTDATSCTATSNTLNVTAYALPAAYITASGPTALCLGDSVTLTSGPAYSYVWSNASVTQSIVVSTAGSYSVSVTDTNGCSNTSAVTPVTVSVCSVSIPLKAFIQGFYKGSGTMEAVVDRSGHPGLCDTVTLELHGAVFPYDLQYTVPGTLDIQGNGTFVFPGSAYSGSYYLVIRHRNSIETWSASPVALNATVVNYDFSDLAGKAFGNNLSDLGDGNFAIYNGDINQDGYINALDFVLDENETQLKTTGYVNSDLTGDWIVESSDYSLLENNVQRSIGILRP